MKIDYIRAQLDGLEQRQTNRTLTRLSKRVETEEQRVIRKTKRAAKRAEQQAIEMAARAARWARIVERLVWPAAPNP